MPRHAYIDDSGVDSKAVYEYDRNGNRTLEAFFKLSEYDRHMANEDEVVEQLKYRRQFARAEYDALNRITSIRDPEYLVEYGYDEVGNRRSVTSQTISRLGEYGEPQAFYYTFDNLNRFTTTMGTLNDDNVIELGEHGTTIGYDTRGRRSSATSNRPLENGPGHELKNYTYTYVYGDYLLTPEFSS